MALGLGAGGASGAGEWQVEAYAGSVSVTAREAALEDVLGEIVRQADLTLELDGSLSGTTSQSFQDLPLAAAIHRLLKSRSFILEYANKPGSGPRPYRLSILADGPAAPSETSPRPPAELRHARLLAVSALAAEGGEEATRALVAAALNDADAAVRREAVHALGEVAGETGIATLEQALMDADRGVRESAAAAFADIGTERAAQALGAALSDADPSLREEAVDALGDIGGPTATALLRAALDDVEPTVREAAAEYLAELPEG